MLWDHKSNIKTHPLGGFGGEWIHVYVWLTSETITTLLMGITLLQNTKFERKKILSS